MASKFQPIKTIQPTGKLKGIVFFFHGRGGNSYTIFRRVQRTTRNNFSFPHLKVIYPTAPKIPYTPYGGLQTNVWFDRYSTTFNAPEHRETLEKTCKDLSILITQEMEKNNLSNDQIIFGGFSMGGAFALNLAFRNFPKIAGVFSLSSFLSQNTNIYDKIKEFNSKCPVFIANGKLDNLVKYEWGYETFHNLKKAGIHGQFRSFNGGHELNLNVVLDLKDWIVKIISKN